MIVYPNTAGRLCEKCGVSSNNAVRHHKGGDRLLSLISKEIANQYYKYNNCVTLCRNCHKEIHTIYQKYLDGTFRFNDEESALRMRSFLIKRCNWWLADMSEPPNTNWYERPHEPVLDDTGGSGPEPAPDAGAI